MQNSGGSACHKFGATPPKIFSTSRYVTRLGTERGNTKVTFAVTYVAGMRERRTVVEWVGRSHCNKRRLGVKVKTITLDVLPCRVSFFPNDLIPNVQRYILSTELPLPQTKSAQRIMLSN